MKIDYLLKGWEPDEMRTLNDVDSIFINDRYILFYSRNVFFESVELEKIDYLTCLGKVNEELNCERGFYENGKLG